MGRDREARVEEGRGTGPVGEAFDERLARGGNLDWNGTDRLKRRLLAGALAGALALLAGCGPSQARVGVDAASGTASAARPPAMPAMPALHGRSPAVTFVAEGGEAVTLDRFAGRIIVLNLWAPWCASCEHELPSLDRLAGQMGAVAVVPVSVDAHHGLAGAERFLQQRALANLAAYHDPDGRVMGLLGARRLPTSFVIDRRGRIAAVVEGAVDWTSEKMLALLLGV